MFIDCRGDEPVLLVHVHVVGGLHRHALEGEAEAAGLPMCRERDVGYIGVTGSLKTAQN